MSTSNTNKSFVVFNGRKPGVYTTWIDSYAQIHGFKESVVRLYDTLSEGGNAWATYSGSKSVSLLRKSQIELAVDDNIGISCDILNDVIQSNEDDGCICDGFTKDILFGHNIEEWLSKACQYMKIEQPFFTLHNMKDIHGKRHYRYRASISHKSTGKPPVSLGKYARTVERACEDAAIILMRRLLACNGKKIADYNQYNVDILESQLQRALHENFEIRMENEALVVELSILSTTSSAPKAD